MASEDVQTNLRLPADLKDRLQASASENNRSLSAEVASRLEMSYSADTASREVQEAQLRAAELQGRVDGLEEAVKAAHRVLINQENIIKTMGGLFEVIGSSTPGKTEQGTALIRKLSDMGRAFVENDPGRARLAYEEFLQGGTELHNRAVREKWPGYENEKLLTPLDKKTVSKKPKP